MELVCDLLHERARLVASEKECPEDLKSAVVTLIWATNRADIMELHEVKKQFAKKFGKEFVERAEKDEDRLVNERVAHKLSIRPVRPKREGERKGEGRRGWRGRQIFPNFLVIMWVSLPPTHWLHPAYVRKVFTLLPPSIPFSLPPLTIALRRHRREVSSRDRAQK